MAYLLHIETATQVCSVALSENNRLLSSLESREKNSHSSLLTLLIRDLLDQQHLIFSDLSAVAVSMGPGSYTGLRIGVSVAKGLCYALEIPLLSVPTLQSMAAGAALLTELREAAGCLLCPMIDARRMEVYTALFDLNLQMVKDTSAMIIDETAFQEYLLKNSICFFGDGAEKTRGILEKLPNTFYPQGFEVSAAHMIQQAYTKYLAGFFEDVAYFEPFYLKDFIAGKPKVKGL